MKKSDSNSKELFYKRWLLIISGLFILVGLLVLGLSIYFYIYKADLLAATFEMQYIKVSVVGLIVCGAVVLIFAFVGLCAAVANNRYLLIMYVVVLLLVGLMAIACAVMAIVYKKTWYIDEVRQRMRNRLQKEYGVNVNTSADNAYITNIWDTTQQMWYCCGVEDESWGIYRQSQWYNNQPGYAGTKEYVANLVPASCCLKTQYGVYADLKKCQNWVLGPPNIASGMYRNEALLYKGCFIVGRELLNLVADGVIGLGISLFLIVFVAIAPAILLLINIIRGESDGYAIPPSKAYSTNRNYFYAKAATNENDDDLAGYPLKSMN